jgi:succinate dehydrogenase / fumarate reductase iron-sulfur subunit
MKKTFIIKRFWPKHDNTPYWQTYEIICQKEWTVLDALEAIRIKDPTLAYRRSCRHGICGSCAININGINHLACTTRLAILGEKIKIKPLLGLPIIRDLVVNLERIYQGHVTIKPYLIKTTLPLKKEHLQTPKQRKELDNLYECSLCGACTSACPTFWANKDFLGPHAILKAYRFIIDSRDEGLNEREEVLRHIWRCHGILNCIEACPQELNPFKVINLLRKRLIR